MNLCPPSLRRQSLRFASIGLMFAAAACLPPKKSGSTTQSLDNFANGTANLNHCGPDLAALTNVPAAVAPYQGAVTAPSADLKLAALSALAAVPSAMRVPFFAAGGTIQVSLTTAETCAKIPLTKGEQTFATEAQQGSAPSCWRQEAAGQPPAIYLSANSSNVRNDLVRTFAYVYEQLLIERLEQLAPDMNDASVTAGLAQYAAQRTAVMQGLLGDAAHLGASVPARLSAFQNQDPQHFAAFALAEAVDSFYCSPQTAQTFKQSFPLTYKAFNGSGGLAQQFGPAWFN